MQQIFDTLADSLSLLSQGMTVASQLDRPAGENPGELLRELNAAVAAFDPSATDLVDRMIASLGADTLLGGELARVRELLDNFDFAAAEPLLAAIDVEASISAAG